LFSDSATDDQFWDDKEQTISFAPNAHTVWVFLSSVDYVSGCEMI
jgi:hypothetical protein